MTKFYAASFTDGNRLLRTSKSERTYTYAWRVKLAPRDFLKETECVVYGFAGNKTLAENQVAAYRRNNPRFLAAEVVEACLCASKKDQARV